MTVLPEGSGPCLDKHSLSRDKEAELHPAAHLAMLAAYQATIISAGQGQKSHGAWRKPGFFVGSCQGLGRIP